MCLIKPAYRNLKRSAKIAKVTRNFIATKKYPDEYRKNNRNDKLSKSSDLYKEKSGKDPLKPVEKILNSFKPFIILFKIHSFLCTMILILNK